MRTCYRWLVRFIEVPTFECVPNVSVTVFASALGRLTITNRLVARTLFGRDFSPFWASLSGNGLLLRNRHVIVFWEREVFLRKRKIWLRGLFSDAALQLGSRNSSGSHLRRDRLGCGRLIVGEVEVVVGPSELNAQQIGGKLAPRIIVFVFGSGRRLFGHERSGVHEVAAWMRTDRVNSRSVSRRTAGELWRLNGLSATHVLKAKRGTQVETLRPTKPGECSPTRARSAGGARRVDLLNLSLLL